MEYVNDFSTFVNEAKVLAKRKYTDSYPEHVVSDKAPIREKVLAFVQEKGSVSRDELLEFLTGINEETGGNTSMKWVHKNARYFNVREKNGYKIYSLSTIGERVYHAIQKHLSESLESSSENNVLD